jgi:hypothetical protein
MDATPKRDRKDTRFRPYRPPDGLDGEIRRLPAALRDAGKRLLNTARRPSPPLKCSVYNRPWLIKEQEVAVTLYRSHTTETRQA